MVRAFSVMDVGTSLYYFISLSEDDMILKVEYNLRLKEFKLAQKEKRVDSYCTERKRIVHERFQVSWAKCCS